MSSENDTIELPIDSWFFKRMGKVIALFLGFSAWFFYDGFVSYPKDNVIFREHEAFQKIMAERDEFLLTETDEAAWDAVAKEKGHPPQTSWKEFAATKNWPEKPPKELHDEWDLRGQYFFGTLCGLVGLGVLVWTLMNRGRNLKADGDAFTTPTGTRVPFDQVFRIDKRKWPQKGLAHIFYKDDNGAKKKTVIDDLKFRGADRILDRLMNQFEGELIELPPEEESET
ncbi:MAG: hypothetical protein AAF514_19935 [Verrucomicrobiota bacterium]